MRINRLQDGIVLIDAKDQYEITSTFIRLQEFYESPFPEIQGQVFELDDYMDLYAERTGNFTYFSDWNGFNIPGDVVREFFTKFKYLRPKERKLESMLADYLQSDQKFYLIGTHSDQKDHVKLDYIKHELAHAFFYLYDSYHQNMLDLVVQNSKFFKRVKVILKEWGYCNDVMADEFQAYMATSGFWYLAAKFGFWVMVDNIDVIKEFEAYFETSFDELDLSKL